MLSLIMECKSVKFDVTVDSLDSLGALIVKCVKREVDLICYSSETMRNPNKPMVKIPGLTLLFVKACLQQGLLGYLDYKQENNYTDQTQIVIDNIVIITCGSYVKSEKGKLSYDIDNNKLTYIRDKSTAKFKELIG